MKDFLNLTREFESRPSLCNWFRLYAYDTWRRIEFARNHWGLKIFETTITQNLLYQFALYKQLRNLPVEMYESLDERANGNDIEFEYQFGNKELYLPMQAKIAYGDGYYPRMEHGAQIESLISYAEGLNGYPLYILYNYWTDINPDKFKGTDCGVRYDIHQYGISLVSAYHLEEHYYNKRLKSDGSYAWKIPHFNNLHPQYAIPWFMLVCCESRLSPLDVIWMLDPKRASQKSKGIASMEPSDYLQPIEERDKMQWKPMELEESFGELQEFRVKYESLRRKLDQLSTFEETESSKKVYNPKYKIVLRGG